MTKKKHFLDIIAETRFLHILLSVLLGFLVGAIFLMIMGLSVGAAYGRLINSVTSLKGFSYVIVYSIPYITVGLSVAFSFKTGVFNIGAEGQFVVGSMAAACTGILCANVPKPLLIPMCFLAAMLAGAGRGLFGSLDEAVRRLVVPGKKFEPEREWAPALDRQYGLYRKLYSSVKELFKESMSK